MSINWVQRHAAKTIIAIDPGGHGAIAVLPNDATRAAVMNMPDTEGDLIETLRNLRDGTNNPVAYIENISGFTKGRQSGPSMFKFGRNFGAIIVATQCLGIRIVLVPPNKWQKALGLGTSTGLDRTEWKNKLKAEAQRRYPQEKVTLNTADALLLLDYAIAQEKGVKLEPADS